jgi:DNA polymerase I-like protein with 3'-5' exonuclease and polymerase domains
MRYPTMKTWKGQAVAQARMDGGVINMFGGSTTVMLCDPSKNARFVPASYGQGGTAGNINNAMLRLYFLADQMWREGFRMIIQIHDELVCSVPDGCYHLVAQKVAIMESPCTIHGRTFTVPVEAEMTRSWQAKWTTKFKGLDKADILTYDKSLDENEQAVLKSLGLLTT